MKRVSEHIKNPSAIREHRNCCPSCKSFSSNDFIDLFSVVEKANSDFDLQISEALHILDKNPQLNKQLSNNGTSFILNIYYYHSHLYHDHNHCIIQLSICIFDCVKCTLITTPFLRDWRK